MWRVQVLESASKSSPLYSTEAFFPENLNGTGKDRVGGLKIESFRRLYAFYLGLRPPEYQLRDCWNWE